MRTFLPPLVALAVATVGPAPAQPPAAGPPADKPAPAILPPVPPPPAVDPINPIPLPPPPIRYYESPYAGPGFTPFTSAGFYSPYTSGGAYNAYAYTRPGYGPPPYNFGEFDYPMIGGAPIHYRPYTHTGHFGKHRSR